MGYCAKCDGHITFKNDVTVEDIKKTLAEFDLYEIEYDILSDKKPLEMFLWENDDHYHSEHTDEFLELLEPLVAEGTINYDGDDNCYWRFRYTDKGWLEEGGRLVYNDDDMIKALAESGYRIAGPAEPDPDAMDIAEWLANKEGHGADDITFAECMVMFSKIWLDNVKKEDALSKEDMKNFDIARFTDRLKDTLDEILNSDDIDSSAWWK